MLLSALEDEKIEFNTISIQIKYAYFVNMWKLKRKLIKGGRVVDIYMGEITFLFYIQKTIVTYIVQKTKINRRDKKTFK